MSPYRIIVTDDHVLFRQGLRRILEGIPDLEVIGETKDGLELLELLQKSNPDLVILDISMPNLRGLEATHEIKKTDPKMKVLILTMHKENEYLTQALSAGADGYLLKEDADTELLAAIESVRYGKTYVSHLLSGKLAEEWAQRRRGNGKTPLDLDPLTTREKEILKLIAEGKLSKEIADLFFISVRTVERHRANMMDKLNLKNTAELVKYAIQKGYV